MQLGRMFSTDKYKGTKNYLNLQKRYEVLRTVIYFGISISLFIAGIVVTKSRENLLTVVAILGCLPASKSAVGMIMFLRYQGCSQHAVQEIERCCDGRNEIEPSYDRGNGLYDMVFTSNVKNYPVAHLTVKGKTICCYTEYEKFDERAFQKHISDILKLENYTDITIKVFTNLKKYTERIQQLQDLEADEKVTEKISNTLKSISL